MRASLFLLLLGVASTASAQTTGSVLRLDFAGQNSRVVSPRDCDVRVAITWNAVAQGVPCSNLSIWVTSGQCGNEPADADLEIDDPSLNQSTWPTQRSGTVYVTVNQLPNFSSGTSCGQAVEQDLKVCGSYQYSSFACASGSNTTVKATPVTLRYDGVAPGPPTLGEIVPLDAALSVSVAGDADTSIIYLEYRRQGEAEFVSGGAIGTDRTSARITGLENGVTYEVRARGEDRAGNVGQPSEVVSGTPVHTEGFFDKYRRQGGEEQGGCAAGAGGPLAWVAAVLLAGFSFSRRRRG